MRPRPRGDARDRSRGTQEKYDAWLAALGKPAAPAGGAGGGGSRSGAGRQDDLHVGRRHCEACHTLADAGTTGTIGPDLDKVLKGKDEAFIKQSIEDPSAEIADGYSDGIMPPSYEQTLGPESSTRW